MDVVVFRYIMDHNLMPILDDVLDILMNMLSIHRPIHYIFRSQTRDHVVEREQNHLNK
jgi:hypothetical protein